MSTKTLEAPVSKTETAPTNKLVVVNDDFNTFGHVIESFVKVLKHSTVQAEQCAIIIHYKGRCSVKEGSYKVLEPFATALLERGISCDIE